jgi:hypothetical protein
MKAMNKKILGWKIFCPFLLLLPPALFSQQAPHPSIMLTKQNLPAIIKGIEDYPLLKRSFIELKQVADKAINLPVNVPVPKDGGGGFTHEQHKLNYQSVLACGLVYQVTKNSSYAGYVKHVLLSYAAQYEQWPLHPKSKSTNPAGKIFWQNLNDCVWQVYMIQGYDLVYDYISAKDRHMIEQHLFFPVIKFLMVDNAETFDRIHNHGTWCDAAVGMTGYVLHQDDWVEKALKGSKKDGKTGWLAQVDQLFSPDGYYTEGPYYQRYAILPFLLFAKAVNQYQPELKIYSYRDSILKKAINTALQLTYTNGAFFPINDALKEKTFESEELIYGVDLAYADMEASPDLLDVAQKQNRVIISFAGLKIAKHIAAGEAKPFQYRSLWVRDGGKGDEGGLGILRTGNNSDEQCILLKAAAQGMGHGHFDRLNFLYYDNGTEIFSDYGSARFLNIETKGGGDYLPENKSWAKQTIAHNTVVVDKMSQYGASLEKAEAHHAGLIYFNNKNSLQVVSAKETAAYNGIELIRTIAVAGIKELEKPLIIDVFKITSDKEHEYDLPYWYQGQITNISFPFESHEKNLQPLGNDFGYQHIWLNANSNSGAGSAAVTFLTKNRFYTTSFLMDTSTRVDFVTVGANDPYFNLRNEKGFIIAQPKAQNHVFISLIESHGNTDPIAETTRDIKGKVQSLKLISDSDQSTSFQFSIANKNYVVTINYKDKENFISIK